MSQNLAETVMARATALEAFACSCASIAMRTLPRSEFEHAQEARTAFLLLQGHAKALRLLAGAGPLTAPSGWPIARSMLEVGLRTAWRIDDDDPFVAEARWARWLASYVTYEKKHSQSLAAEGLQERASRAEQIAAEAAAFLGGFESQLLERGVSVQKQEPNLREIMRQLGLPAHSYSAYSEASERLHGSFVAMDAYSRNLGTMREHGEFSEWQDWLLPVAHGMGGTYVLAQVFASRTDSGQLWEEISAMVKVWHPPGAARL